jgi:hypothetical protein
LDGADIGAPAEFISCKSEVARRKNDIPNLKVAA